jgi:hypothetical protein
MNILKFTLGLALLSSSAAFSQEVEMCKSFCAADKKECRSSANYNASIYTDPPIAQHEKQHPLSDHPFDSTLRNNSAADLKSALNQKCEASYMKCVQACKPQIEKSRAEK